MKRSASQALKDEADVPAHGGAVEVGPAKHGGGLDAAADALAEGEVEAPADPGQTAPGVGARSPMLRCLSAHTTSATNSPG